MTEHSLLDLLRARFAAALATVAGPAASAADALVRPSGDPKFGDYQCNAAMPLAKPLGARPRDIAQRIVDAVDLADIAEPLQIAGPGFINITLRPGFLARYLGAVGPAPAAGDDRLAMAPHATPERIVVDYSSPNVAKQMHVGHLRTTIIGDAIVRLLSFQGHEVIRQNHVGDWGTQFGMLIRWYHENPLPDPAATDDVLEAIESDYRKANERFKNDPAFAAEARAAVGKLQGGDESARQVWLRLRELSQAAFDENYQRLGVLLTPADTCGESFYNDQLAATVARLRGDLPPQSAPPPGTPYAEVREDQGALCVFLYDQNHEPAFKNPDGDALPMIIQKSDGAFLYASTDLAAVRYRLHVLQADRVIYVVGLPQAQHFRMLFMTAVCAGWARPGQLVHVAFGSVLGENRKPLRTRDGQNVKLRDLLDEAEKRAYEVLAQREVDADATTLDEAEKRLIAQRVGIAAITYADLSRDRTGDYVFNWDTMLQFQGNTAPYMMYAYARIRSIYRKAAERFGEPDVYAPGNDIALDTPAERALALKLARLHETLDAVAADLQPHVLCTYLYELASEFSRFYEACPVIDAPSDAVRLSRMRLCDLTARALQLGLRLIGIDVIERM